MVRIKVTMELDVDVAAIAAEQDVPQMEALQLAVSELRDAESCIVTTRSGHITVVTSTALIDLSGHLRG